MADPEHDDGKKNPGVFKKASSNTYRKNTKSGYQGGGWQAHHVLVGDCFHLHSVKDSALAKYIRSCYKVTPWNINEHYNMLGLPVLKSYVVAYKDMDGGGKQAGKKEFKHLVKYLAKKLRLKAGVHVASPHNLPCHQPVNWGHTDYTKEVDHALKARIWNTLDKSDDKHKSATVIKGLLDTLAKEFTGKLEARGGREGGTALNWRERHEPARGDTWFHPFCMSADPTKDGIA